MTEWNCGCGHVNGSNLATCARCGRTPSEGNATGNDDAVDSEKLITDHPVLHRLCIPLEGGTLMLDARFIKPRVTFNTHSWEIPSEEE
jgi:hypothetical protein